MAPISCLQPRRTSHVGMTDFFEFFEQIVLFVEHQALVCGGVVDIVTKTMRLSSFLGPSSDVVATIRFPNMAGAPARSLLRRHGYRDIVNRKALPGRP